MAIHLVSPRVGYCREVVLQRWTADDGEWVTAGHPLCLLKTEHSLIPLLALEDGFFQVRRPPIPPGTRLKWATPLGTLLVPGSDLSASPPLTPKLPSRVPCRVVPPALSGEEHPTRPDRGPRMSPRARRLTREMEIDLTTVVGTGRDGRIRVRDLEGTGVTRRKSRTSSPGPRRRRADSRLAESPEGQIVLRAAPWQFTATWELRKSEAPRNVEKLAEGDAESATRPSPAADTPLEVTEWQGLDRLLLATFRAMRHMPLHRVASKPQFPLNSPTMIHLLAARDSEGALREQWLSFPNPEADGAMVEIQKQLASGAGTPAAQDGGSALLSVVDLGSWPIDSFLAPIPPRMLGVITAGRPTIQVVPVSGKLHVKWIRQLTLALDSEQVPLLTSLKFQRHLVAALNSRR